MSTGVSIGASGWLHRVGQCNAKKWAARQRFQQESKGVVYYTERECSDASRGRLQSIMEAGAYDAFSASKRGWDDSGRHSRVVP